MQNHFLKSIFSFCLASSLLVLSACDAVTKSSVDDWMLEQQKTIKPNIKPIPQPKNFIPKSYTTAGLTDPFDNQKLLEALRRMTADASANVAILAPEQARKKEPLEDYPLDSIAMVGTLNQNGVPMALVKVNDLLYQVKVGDYLGQNYGRIKSIGDADLVLREIVQDAAGEWIEKDTALQIRENLASTK